MRKYLENPKTGTEKGVVSLKVAGDRAALLDLGPSIPITDGTGAVVGTRTIDDIRISLSEISLTDGQVDKQVGGTFSGPYAVNLLTNEISPSPSTISVPPDTYTAIQLTLGTLPTGANGGLSLSGTIVSNGGHQKHLQLVLDSGDEFSLPLAQSQTGGIVVKSNLETQVLVSFHLGKWLSGVGADLSALAGDVIDLKSSGTGPERSLWDKIRRNIERAADIRRGTP